ncbi:glycosyltransferase family 4 protein, partial [candidate division WOR-3 bacterium]|nr:glycosyltransferase family 4 protein [candidate division WOR-3 bacterium]
LNVINNSEYHCPKNILRKSELMDNIGISRFSVNRFAGDFKLYNYLDKRGFSYITGYKKTISFSLINAIRKNIRNYDYILTGTMPFTSVIYPALKYAKMYGKKSILMPLIHFGIPGDNRYRYEYFSNDCISLYKQADIIISNSHYEEDFLRHNGYKRDIVRLNPYIEKSNIVRENSKNKPFTIISLGFNNFEKGTYTLIKAFELLKKQMNIRLIIAGKAERECLKAIHSVKGIDYLGEIDDKAKGKLFLDGDIYVQLSLAESFGIATLEAHASGIPSINAFCSGSMYIIEHGKNGFLVPFGDHVEAAEYIKHLYLNKEKRLNMGLYAKKAVEKFNYNNHENGINNLEGVLG